MATLVSINSALASERRFFFFMAVALSVTAVAGFSFFIIMGMSSFGAPWWVHVHGLTMMSWLGLYVVQNGLVLRGQLAAHRRLGPFLALWSLWMLAVGLSVTVLSLRAGRAPPFFEPTFFLVMDWLNVIAFVVLIWAGLAMRHRPDWHKRLMLGATIIIIAPGVGRLMPLPLLGNAVIWSILLVLLIFFAVAMVRDVRTRGAVHPAYYCGAGAALLFVLLIAPIAGLPPVAALVSTLTG